VRTIRRRLRYGGSWFAAASALPIGGGLGRPDRLAHLVVVAATRPWQATALLVLLVRTPKVEVTLSDSAAGDALRKHFDAWFLGVFPQNRLCRGVLFLPRKQSEYVRGRRRQAVRTNVRRAEAAGIWCETVEGPSEAMRAVRRVVHSRQAAVTDEDLARLAHDWPLLFEQPDVTALVARDAEGIPLAVTAVLIDDEVSLIRLAVASSHEARWSLHHHLVLNLIDRGVKYLLSEGEGPFGALGFTPDVQYYQRRLGYDLCHIIPRSARVLGVPARRRSAASLTAGSGAGHRPTQLIR